MNANGAVRMPLLDVAFYLMDSVRSPQDFTLIFHFRDLPGIEALKAGARSAMNRFPTTASCINRQKWIWREDTQFQLDISYCESTSEIERLIDKPFDLRHQPPVKQALVLNESGGARLVTRFHHASADGLSAALWLGHQLNVAYGLEAVERERAPFVDLSLRRLASSMRPSVRPSVRRSQFAFKGASDPLWTSRSERSGSRRWLTIGFPASDLQKSCRRVGGFTYSDLLATCTLEVLSQWNNKHRSDTGNIGLWVPMNIRRESTAGFGNGSSRIRLYARYKAGVSLIEKCREVRRQVSWTTKHGEWVVPDIAWLTRLPRPIAGTVLRRYLNLPSVDMATGVFSHASSWIAHADEAFKHVERIECIGLLHPRQGLAINAATHYGQTWLSFTYDPQLLTVDDVRQLAEIYEQQIVVAQAEML